MIKTDVSKLVGYIDLDLIDTCATRLGQTHINLVRVYLSEPDLL